MISLSLTLGGELMILMVTRSASFGGRSRRGRLRVNRVDFGMSTLGLLSLDSGHPGWPLCAKAQNRCAIARCAGA